MGIENLGIIIRNLLQKLLTMKWLLPEISILKMIQISWKRREYREILETKWAISIWSNLKMESLRGKVIQLIVLQIMFQQLIKTNIQSQFQRYPQKTSKVKGHQYVQITMKNLFKSRKLIMLRSNSQVSLSKTQELIPWTIITTRTMSFWVKNIKKDYRNLIEVQMYLSCRIKLWSLNKICYRNLFKCIKSQRIIILVKLLLHLQKINKYWNSVSISLQENHKLFKKKKHNNTEKIKKKKRS